MGIRGLSLGNPTRLILSENERRDYRDGILSPQMLPKNAFFLKDAFFPKVVFMKAVSTGLLKKTRF